MAKCEVTAEPPVKQILCLVPQGEMNDKGFQLSTNLSLGEGLEERDSNK